MNSRRTFIQQAGLLSAGLLIAPEFLWASRAKVVGIQLYTLRELIFKDVRGVISKVAAAGFRDVETYGYDAKNRFFGLEPLEFKKLLQSKGMASTSGHYSPNEFLSGSSADEIKYFIEAANLLEQQHLVIPYLKEDLRQTADDYKRLAEKLNIAGELCNTAKLQLAYHNHDFEFKQFGEQTGYDILLKETDRSIVDMELDLYWITRAGKDPVDYFTRYPGRFIAWHIKDMDKTDPKINADVGTGSINFKRIFAKAKLAGVQHYYVEYDTLIKNPFEGIARSCSYVKNTLLK